jgi:hypothetical protein
MRAGSKDAGNIVGALSSTLGFFLTIMMAIAMWVALVAVPVVFLFLWVAGYF